jgi:hypothetical protein
VYRYHIFLIHLSVVGHLGYFHNLAIVNRHCTSFESNKSIRQMTFDLAKWSILVTAFRNGPKLGAWLTEAWFPSFYLSSLMRLHKRTVHRKCGQGWIRLGHLILPEPAYLLITFDDSILLLLLSQYSKTLCLWQCLFCLGSLVYWRVEAVGGQMHKAESKQGK